METWITLALPGAVAYATSLLGDRNRGEDIVQDCICRLLGHAARYDLPRDGRKLLFRAITNACINERTRGERTLSLDEQGRPPEGGTWELEDITAPTPSTLVLAEELRVTIAEGLQTLPIRQRSALELSSFGYRAEEIAEMLQVQSDHVRLLLFRARKAMAAFLNARFCEGVDR
ncbi:MAG: RNA polymerase sigma factor [Pirellulales bacterium]|nr:RNA polymerase sigma factor [Pirellulales bacterium]